MRLLTAKMPPAQGVAAGQTAIIPLTLGRTYHNFQLLYSGITLPQIKAVRLRADGEVIMELGSGSNIDSRNLFDGLEAAAGVLHIGLERESLQLPDARMMTVIGTGWNWSQDSNDVFGVVTDVVEAARRQALEIKTLQMEIDIDAAAAAPAFSLYAQQSGKSPLAMLRRLYKWTVQGIAGFNEVVNLPRNLTTNRQINRIFIQTANTTDVKVYKDGLTLFERTKALNELYQKNGWRVPQTGYVVIDPTENGLGNNLIDVFDAQDFRLQFTLSSAENVTLWVESLGILK